jgi:hypothetical protein
LRRLAPLDTSGFHQYRRVSLSPPEWTWLTAKKKRGFERRVGDMPDRVFGAGRRSVVPSPRHLQKPLALAVPDAASASMSTRGGSQSSHRCILLSTIDGSILRTTANRQKTITENTEGERPLRSRVEYPAAQPGEGSQNGGRPESSWLLADPDAGGGRDPASSGCPCAVSKLRD